MKIEQILKNQSKNEMVLHHSNARKIAQPLAPFFYSKACAFTNSLSTSETLSEAFVNSNKHLIDSYSLSQVLGKYTRKLLSD